ncbi:unnamed protein product [Rotaria sordida]|uniref:Uncharacterized protein n=1 Tax=Rotaria sordida TaxID=392033 RepID=A0A814C880_9BILA|nr:unnamed protein product [Rotaria sordida]CAF0940022.1 unnamed protein product [Rotaria sordida]CAF0940681.1 unnamed protein product [Rotaria sordida]
MIDWIKNENDSINIIYFQNNFIIETEQFFDNETFHIRLKMDENIQSSLQMLINDYIDENDGSLKDVDEFILEIRGEIFDLEMVNKRKRWEEEKKGILN